MAAQARWNQGLFGKARLKKFVERRFAAVGILRKLTPIVLALAFSHDLVSVAHSDTAAIVPFVGCASDGQLGPLPASTRGREPPTAPLLQAPELAFYASADLGVLAPRDWHCVGLYGSNGAILIVTLEPHSADDLLKSNSGLTGPAIQL